MAKSGYVTTSGSVSLVASTLKYVLGVQAGTEFGVDLKKIRVSLNGTDATDAPTVVELVRCTFATNPPGTNSSSATIDQAYGRLASTGFLAASNWTSVPTVVGNVVEDLLLTPNGGLVMYDIPLGDTPDSPLNQGFVLRCTAADAVSVRATMWWERA